MCVCVNCNLARKGDERVLNSTLKFIAKRYSYIYSVESDDSTSLPSTVQKLLPTVRGGRSSNEESVPPAIPANCGFLPCGFVGRFSRVGLPSELSRPRPSRALRGAPSRTCAQNLLFLKMLVTSSYALASNFKLSFEGISSRSTVSVLNFESTCATFGI